MLGDTVAKRPANHSPMTDDSTSPYLRLPVRTMDAVRRDRAHKQHRVLPLDAVGPGGASARGDIAVDTVDEGNQ